MSALTSYGSRADLRSRIDVSGTQAWTSAEDSIHDGILDAVSRMIDDYCGQFFYLTASAARVFSAEWPDVLVVPPLVSITSLKTDETGSGVYSRTWASTDYVLWPDNAALAVPARPYLEIRVDQRTTSQGLAFPLGQRAVEVTGPWGWPAVPGPIREVCLLESQRMVQQAQAPAAIVASPELGQFVVQPQLHPTSKLLLRPYRRMGMASRG